MPDAQSLFSQPRPIHLEDGGAAYVSAILSLMDSFERVLEWAESHIENLTKDMTGEPKDSVYGGFWRAADPQAKGRIRARAMAALNGGTQNADAGERRVLWADGDDLISGIKEIPTEFGFNVQDMDAPLGPKDARREDLRLRCARQVMSAEVKQRHLHKSESR